MSLPKSSFTTILFVLIGAGIISWFLFFMQAEQKDTVQITKLPKVIGTWSSIDLTITPDEYAILETRNAFVRKYTNSVDKSEVYLYIVYSESNRKVAHPPEICYTGGGYAITENVHDPIVLLYSKNRKVKIETNRLHLTKGNIDEISFYWFKVGKDFTANYWKQQFLIAWNTLQGKKTSSALIRISAEIVGGDDAKAIKDIKAFTGVVVPNLYHYLP